MCSFILLSSCTVCYFVLYRHVCNDRRTAIRQRLCSSCECVLTSAILCSPKNEINSECVLSSITCDLALYFGGSPSRICKCKVHNIIFYVTTDVIHYNNAFTVPKKLCCYQYIFFCKLFAMHYAFILVLLIRMIVWLTL